MQEWDADTFPDSSKGDTIKASSKLFLFHRFRSKKLKNNNKSPKNKHEASMEDSGPELDSPPSPKVCFANNESRCPNAVRVLFFMILMICYLKIFFPKYY